MKGRYHLTRKDREITDEKAIEHLLKGCRLAFVSLCSDYEPYVVAMNYGYDEGRGSLYFHCALKGHKLELIKANPAACALIFEDDGYVDGKCEHKYRSLVVRGDIVVADTLDEKKHGIDILIRHQESDPRTVRSRNLTNDADYDIFNILRLDIDDITAKESV